MAPDSDADTTASDDKATPASGADTDGTKDAEEGSESGGVNDASEGASESYRIEDADSDPTPSIIPLADVRDVWSSVEGDSESFTRDVKRDLTPDEIEFDRPDEFDFGYIPTEDLPSGVQYTPEFDPDWVYPSGSSDGGRQDDTPVQGLEIGVLATDETIEAAVRAVLDTISLYYEDTGQYPRHRIIESASAFEETATDGVGLVAVLQPSPDDHDGLVDHMQAVQSGDEGAIDSNVETSRLVVQYLGAQLASEDLGTLSGNPDVVTATGWETAAQIGTLPIAERYAPLGAAEVYDPAIEDLDLSEDGVPSVADAEFAPQRLSIETNAELFDTPDSSE